MRVCAPGILPTTIFDFNSIVCSCSRAVFRDISKNLAPRVIGFKHLGHMLIFDRRISENEAPRVTVCRHVGHMLVFDRQISGSPSLCILTAAGRLLINTSCGTRACNLRIRSPTPCPLGQGGSAIHPCPKLQYLTTCIYSWGIHVSFCAPGSWCHHRLGMSIKGAGPPISLRSHHMLPSLSDDV